MSPEASAIKMLSTAADRAATKCGFCGKFGHGATLCPDLARVNRPGVSVQMVTTDHQSDRAYTIFLLMLGFFVGIGLTKLVEALLP